MTPANTRQATEMTVTSKHTQEVLTTRTFQLCERFSQNPQLFALLLHILLCHQAVVDGWVPLQLLHGLLQVTVEDQVTGSYHWMLNVVNNVSSVSFMLHQRIQMTFTQPMRLCVSHLLSEATVLWLHMQTWCHQTYSTSEVCPVSYFEKPKSIFLRSQKSQTWPETKLTRPWSGPDIQQQLSGQIRLIIQLCVRSCCPCVFLYTAAAKTNDPLFIVLVE